MSRVSKQKKASLVPGVTLDYNDSCNLVVFPVFLHVWHELLSVLEDSMHVILKLLGTSELLKRVWSLQLHEKPNGEVLLNVRQSCKHDLLSRPEVEGILVVAVLLLLIWGNVKLQIAVLSEFN